MLRITVRNWHGVPLAGKDELTKNQLAKMKATAYFSHPSK
jgi:hypothetical protein